MGAFLMLSLGLFVTPTLLIYVIEQCLLKTMRQGCSVARCFDRSATLSFVPGPQI